MWAFNQEAPLAVSSEDNSDIKLAVQAEVPQITYQVGKQCQPLLCCLYISTSEDLANMNPVLNGCCECC